MAAVLWLEVSQLPFDESHNLARTHETDLSTGRFISFLIKTKEECALGGYLVLQLERRLLTLRTTVKVTVGGLRPFCLLSFRNFQVFSKR